MNELGEFTPIRLPKKDGGTEIAQGRFIVHPPVRDEIMHEGIYYSSVVIILLLWVCANTLLTHSLLYV